MLGSLGHAHEELSNKIRGVWGGGDPISNPEEGPGTLWSKHLCLV